MFDSVDKIRSVARGNSLVTPNARGRLSDLNQCTTQTDNSIAGSTNGSAVAMFGNSQMVPTACSHMRRFSDRWVWASQRRRPLRGLSATTVRREALGWPARHCCINPPCSVVGWG